MVRLASLKMEKELDNTIPINDRFYDAYATNKGKLRIPVSLFFVVTGILGEIYFWGASALGFGYLISGIPLLKDTTVDNAKLLLKTSVIYLPALLIVIFIDLNS